ncbi:MAG: peptidylprolyl isomerase [Pseudomonadota bacterium]
MTHRILSGLAAAAAAGLLSFGVVAPVSAQDAMDPGTVLAVVDGYEITEEEVALASQDFAQQLQQVPGEQRRAVIVDALIDLHLLAGAADEEGLDETDEFQRRMAYERARTLRTAYLVDVIAADVTEESIRAAYDEAVSEFEPMQERRARHILLESQDEAMEVITALDEGGDFATLASERSTGPSAANGGDLGFFGPGRMVPAFEEAAFALDVGGYSQEPVETRFGWHVILVEEVRESAPPSFEELGPQIQQTMLQQRFTDSISSLRDGAQISYEVEGLEPPLVP